MIAWQRVRVHAIAGVCRFALVPIAMALGSPVLAVSTRSAWLMASMKNLDPL